MVKDNTMNGPSKILKQYNGPSKMVKDNAVVPLKY